MNARNLFQAVLVTLAVTLFEIVVIMSAVVFFALIAGEAVVWIVPPVLAADYDYSPGAELRAPPVLVQPPPVVVFPSPQARCHTERTTEHDGILDTDNWTEREVCDEPD
ncbi:MAG: hypothetical protein USCAAHI_01790 [Beijerinckiaceae bacterium]|nr:MAG: hypothetical protein USCAAHI_01790 [Beijerinckiaceae bacterium]